MKLHRFVIVIFSPLKIDLPGWFMDIANVRVETHKRWVNGEKKRYLVSASVPLNACPDRGVDGLVNIPIIQRSLAEFALESSINMVAVNYCASRSISSPTPCVTFEAESEEEMQWLSDSRGIKFNKRVLFSPVVNHDLPKCLSVFIDRLDGVSLMAEAMSHDHATGKFHELMRLFERAFACGPHELVAPLAAFLAMGQHFGYTKDEVSEWLDSIRHLATHADRRDYFLTEAHVRPYIGRIHQAAYDVLFNKETWRKRDSKRRDMWKPCAGTNSPRDSQFAYLGSKFDMNMQILDQVGVYPSDLKAIIKMDSLPKNHWAKDPDTRDKLPDNGVIETFLIEGIPNAKIILSGNKGPISTSGK